MKHLNLVTALLGAVLILSLSGCGSDNRESSTAPQVRASQACIGCHSTTPSPITGNSIVAEYLHSAHSSAPGGAGCNDCHQVGGHPGDGSIPAIPNDLVCVTCHTVTVPMSTKAAHFSNISASYTGLPLTKLANTLINPTLNANNPPGTNNSSSSCNGCHNPHDMTSLLSVNKQWANSGHAATTDDAFKEQAFIKNTTCNRCHSATGFRYYMTNGQTPVTLAILGRYSSAKEVIACYACHTNYSWKRISSDPAVTTFVNFSTPYPKYPNVTKRIPGSNFPTPSIGDSKLCIPCHAGRNGNRVGAAITLSATAATAAAPFDSHYFPAAAVMYGKIGFIDFVPQGQVLPAVAAVPASPGVQPTSAILATTYGQSLITSEDISGGVTSTHRKLGTTAINGDSHNPAFFVPGTLDANGPCVVCHMTAGHTLNFDNPVIAGNTYNQVCINCHTSERGVPLNAANFMVAFVDENRNQMFDALSLAVNLLQQKYDIGINLSDVEALEAPQDVSFVQFSTGAPLSGAVWTAYVTTGPGSALSPAEVYNLKGALFNIITCYKENTSFLHARSLTRRLIYDSIDFLDDKLINQTVGLTAIAQSLVGTAATNPVFGKFVKDTRAFITNTSGPLFGNTTPSMTYIIGFDRTTGSWTPPQRERP